MSKRRPRRKGTLKGYLKRFNQEVLKPRSQTDNSRLSTWAIADVGLRRNQLHPDLEFQGTVGDALMQEDRPKFLEASEERVAAWKRSVIVATQGRRTLGWRDWIKEYECVILQKLRYSKTFLYSQGDDFYIVVEDYLAQTIMKTHRYSSRQLAILAFRLKNFSVDVREKL